MLIKRSLTYPEIQLLIKDIAKFPDLAYVSPQQWQNFEHCYVIENNHQFAGICVVHFFSNWVKIGPLVILAKHQGKGYGKKIINQILRDYKDKCIFVSSSNRIVQQIFIRLQFTKIDNFFHLTRPIKLFLIKQFFNSLSVQYLYQIVRKKIILKRSPVLLFIKQPIS